MAPPLSNLVRLECPTCHKTYEASVPRNVCDCGRPLFARYDLGGVTRESLLPRRDLWRYLPVLPVDSEDHALTLGEGGTPLLECPAIERTYGVSRVFVKDEAANPTGTFKARGMAVAVARAKQLGLTRLAVPSAGNAGSALAAYAAKAGIASLVVQAKGCAPIVKAFKDDKEGSELWKNPVTIAPGLRVPKALGDTLVLTAARESRGTGVAVEDEAMREGVSEFARLEGIGACYEGG